MSPPILASDLPPAPVEHHYTMDQTGKPIEIQQVIYVPPSSEEQFHELEIGDKQLDFLEEMIQNAEVKNVVISLNKMRRKLFRENGLLKKRMAALEQENNSIRHELDYVYQLLNIEKRKIKI